MGFQLLILKQLANNDAFPGVITSAALSKYASLMQIDSTNVTNPLN